MTKPYHEIEEEWLEARKKADAQLEIELNARSDGALARILGTSLAWIALQAINLVVFDIKQMSLEEMMIWEKQLQLVEIPAAYFFGRLMGQLTYEDRSML